VTSTDGSAANIHPRLGVFAVRGDVEPDGWEAELFGRLGVVTSDETRTFQVGDLTLTLLSLHDSGNRELSLVPTSTTPNMVLGHRPDFALGTGPGGLLVAGHTHGGQVQVPLWGPPFILSAVPRNWGAGGLYVVDASRSLLVTRGAGVEHADDAPPLRFNCRPEIVLLNIREPEKTAAP
jgi:predicted MPP superfamily phosphohydrolase